MQFQEGCITFSFRLFLFAVLPLRQRGARDGFRSFAELTVFKYLARRACDRIGRFSFACHKYLPYNNLGSGKKKYAASVHPIYYCYTAALIMLDP